MTPKMAKMAINAIYGVISDLENHIVKTYCGTS